jgi:hypothetical protein
MEQLFSELRAEMKRAQAVQSKQVNKSQRVSASLEVGNIVWLDTRNMSTTEPSKKLDWKYIGPYDVTKVVNPRAYPIKLPSLLYIHDVQSIS